MKLIIDVCDMWPEAFPAKCANRLFAFPFLFWRLLRTSALKRADCVLTECNRFSKALANYQAKTVFWSLKKVSDPQALEERLSSSAIHLAYLGSINHILDIERTASLIRELAKKKPVTVHVIGMGEKKTEFLKALRESGATVIDYGAVFEERRLGEIFSYCHAGLNVMKKEVFVGLSMKTLAYFKFGLPVINSLEGDTKDFIERYGVGFQLNDAASLNSISVSEIREMKKRVSQFFSTYLESSVIMNRMLLIFKEIVGGGIDGFLSIVSRVFSLVFPQFPFQKNAFLFPFGFLQFSFAPRVIKRRFANASPWSNR